MDRERYMNFYAKRDRKRYRILGYTNIQRQIDTEIDKEQVEHKDRPLEKSWIVRCKD